ncbi:hypothetical protein HGRIS_005921 [Hohenbuehelia grisea]|uniref:NAD(P)-binding protein n=1 Tax=Hohenbuehelia grisea TaxID=104357 RepID=A0ABR3JYI9_9AGAR
MGGVLSYLDESFPPSSHFNPDSHIPDLSGKVVIITGASSGVGKATSKHLLMHNAKVYMACRDIDKATTAIDELWKETGKEAFFLHLDLADLASTKQAAEEFLRNEPQLHILFNNAGVMMTPMSELTADGYDRQFGVHVLGHFCFTTALFPALMAAATATGSPSRVIHSSSVLQILSKTVDFETLRPSTERDKKGPIGLYAQSKFANIVFSKELARRYGDKGIVSICLNPGTVKTDLQRFWSSTQHFLLGWMLYPPELGAHTGLWAATSSEAEHFNGKYLVPWARLGQTPTAADSLELGQGLWDWMEAQLVGVGSLP